MNSSFIFSGFSIAVYPFIEEQSMFLDTINYTIIHHTKIADTIISSLCFFTVFYSFAMLRLKIRFTQYMAMQQTPSFADNV